MPWNTYGSCGLHLLFMRWRLWPLSQPCMKYERNLFQHGSLLVLETNILFFSVTVICQFPFATILSILNFTWLICHVCKTQLTLENRNMPKYLIALFVSRNVFPRINVLIWNYWVLKLNLFADFPYRRIRVYSVRPTMTGYTPGPS